jgi:hypothetical protein
MSGPFEEARRLAVWNKGRVIPGYSPDVWRHDDFGAVLRYENYGDRNSEFGWEIDHMAPSAFGGTDDLANLRPLHCKNNAGLGGLLGSMLGKT